MATPRVRQYRPPKKGHIDLGSILLGALGGAGVGEVEQAPGEIAPQGPTLEGGYMTPPPAKFRLREGGIKDYTGQGQSLVNEANIRAIQAEEAAQRGLRTKRAEIPIDIESLKAQTPVLTERAKLLADIANDKELQRRFQIDPLDLQKLQDEENIKTQAEAARLEKVEPIRTKYEVERKKALSPVELEYQKQLGGIQTKEEVARREALDPKDVEKARKISIINLLNNEGIIPNEENIAAFNNVLTERRLAEKASGSEARTTESMLNTAGSRRGLEVEEATRPTDLKTAIEKSKFGLGEITGARELQPMAIRAKRAQIPLETESMEIQNARNRLFPTQEGTEYYDMSYPKRPAFSHSVKPMEQVIGTQLKAKYPGIELPFNVPSGNPANYPELYPNGEYEDVIIDGQIARRKKKKVQ